MRTLVLAALSSAFAIGGTLAAETPDYAPLKLYEGAWTVTMPTPKGVAVRISMANSCGRIGVNFACQQALAGAPAATTIFLPTNLRGKWRTQNVSPDGEPGGLPGDLTIDGSVWTFLNPEKTATGVTWTRNINRFTGPDHIHFEIATSPDGQTWTPSISGDEVRARP